MGEQSRGPLPNFESRSEESISITELSMRLPIFSALVMCSVLNGSVMQFSAVAADATPIPTGAQSAQFDQQLYKKTVDRGIEYLLTKGQAADGSYSAEISPAVTALCVEGMLRHGRSPDDPAIAKSIKYL